MRRIEAGAPGVSFRGTALATGRAGVRGKHNVRGVTKTKTPLDLDASLRNWTIASSSCRPMAFALAPAMLRLALAASWT